MALDLSRAAILGATGPTGVHLARTLLARGMTVRAISRSHASLERALASLEIELVAADLLDATAARRAIDGVDVVFDCVGLPMEQIADHPRIARNLAAAALRGTGVRAVQISSFWAYLPIRRLPLTEDHPRAGGPAPARFRREAEDILGDAGAAIINLPDFYGPLVHTSTLQQPLAEAVAGRRVNWIGEVRTEREYVYVPDAMQAAADLALRPEAYGERWIMPGPGPISAAQAMELASRYLGRPTRTRSTGLLMLRAASLFVKPLRSFLPMLPAYTQPIRYDGTKLRSLIGEVPITPYEEGIAHTLAWLTEAPRP